MFERLIIGLLACIGFIAVFGGIVIIAAIFLAEEDNRKEKHKQEEQ